MTLRTPRFVFLLLAICGLFLSTCSDDDPQCPSDGVMKIYGTVTTPRGPLAHAVAVLEGYENGLHVSISTDEAGEYEMTVPEGRYRMVLRPSGSRPMFFARGGPTYRGDDAEVIVASDASPDLRADFRLGTVELTVRAASDFPNLEWGCGMIDARTGLPVDSGVRAWGGGHIEIYFPAVIPGRYCFRVGSLDAHFWYPHAMSLDDARVVDVGSVEPVSLADTLAAPGHVTGTLLGPWAHITDPPLEVQLYAPDSTMMARGSCDADGRFDVPVVVDGVVRLKVEASDQEIWLGGWNIAEADPLTVATGALIDAGAIQTHGITCRMTGEPGWENDAWRAYMNAGEYGVTVDAVKGATAGEWILPLRGPIFSLLKVQWRNPSEWRPQLYDRKTLPEDATPLYVNDANGPTTIDIHLERGGTISGRVLTSDGSPLRYRHVAVRLGGGLYGDWLTGTDGSFRVTGLPDGLIPLAVESSTGWAWYPGTLDEYHAEPIEIVDAGDVTGIEFVLTVAGK